MTTTLSSNREIADWLRQHMRSGGGVWATLTRVVCTPPTTSQSTRCSAGQQIASRHWQSVYSRLDTPPLSHYRTASKSKCRNEGSWCRLIAVSPPATDPPRGYMLESTQCGRPDYIGNSPEVLIELIRSLFLVPVPALVQDPLVQVGFPGQPPGELTYVGSWQWDVHGEARGTEFINRAAAATLAAIEAAGKD